MNLKDRMQSDLHNPSLSENELQNENKILQILLQKDKEQELIAR